MPVNLFICLKLKLLNKFYKLKILLKFIQIAQTKLIFQKKLKKYMIRLLYYNNKEECKNLIYNYNLLQKVIHIKQKHIILLINKTMTRWMQVNKN